MLPLLRCVNKSNIEKRGGMGVKVVVNCGGNDSFTTMTIDRGHWSTWTDSNYIWYSFSPTTFVLVHDFLYTAITVVKRLGRRRRWKEKIFVDSRRNSHRVKWNWYTDLTDDQNLDTKDWYLSAKWVFYFHWPERRHMWSLLFCVVLAWTQQNLHRQMLFACHATAPFDNSLALSDVLISSNK